MLNIPENEKIIMVVHRHWFVMAGTVILLIILLMVPTLVLTALPFLTANLNPATVEPITNLALALYGMVLLLFLFLTWMDFYLDMWIITNERIIDVQQNGLFDRETSEIPMAHIQDVTIDVNGIVETMLKFGTIRIQTAGEREFTLEQVPNIYAVKDAIVKQVKIGGGVTEKSREINKQATN